MSRNIGQNRSRILHQCCKQRAYYFAIRSYILRYLINFKLILIEEKVKKKSVYITKQKINITEE